MSLMIKKTLSPFTFDFLDSLNYYTRMTKKKKLKNFEIPDLNFINILKIIYYQMTNVVSMFCCAEQIHVLHF